MSIIDDQITILEAVRAKRSIECRRRKPSSLANPWVVAKQSLLNFDKFEYRIQPVIKEAWLIYDTKLDTYLSLSYTTPVSASFECTERNRTERGARYVPVKVKPCES